VESSRERKHGPGEKHCQHSRYPLLRKVLDWLLKRPTSIGWELEITIVFTSFFCQIRIAPFVPDARVINLGTWLGCLVISTCLLPMPVASCLFSGSYPFGRSPGLDLTVKNA
jgi:hypothetical protein